MDAVREGDISKTNEVRYGYVYNKVHEVETWCVRYVKHEEPIDNVNPHANIIREYLTEFLEEYSEEWESSEEYSEENLKEYWKLLKE